MNFYTSKFNLITSVITVMCFFYSHKNNIDPVITTKLESVEFVTPDFSEVDDAYFKVGIIRTEVIDSTGEMVEMMDMMVGMMSKDVERQYMVFDNKVMEYKTDVEGNLTTFSIYDIETRIKESYGELDLEPVYTIYSSEDTGKFDKPNGSTLTMGDGTKNIHGYECKSLSIADPVKGMKVVMHYTEEIPFAGLPDDGLGFPLEVELQMGGINIVTGVVEYSKELPHPDYFKVDKTKYREVTNDEFPKSRSMF